MEIKYLYHASSNRDLEVLEPRADSCRDKDEGPVVFASPDKSYVSCFIAHVNDNWGLISKFSFSYRPTIHVMCIADEKKFREIDKGGAIYKLSPEGFYLDKSKGMTEWTSRKSVKPAGKEICESGLDAMIDNNVLVYFCNYEKLEELKKRTNNSKEFFKILVKMRSENEKRGLKGITKDIVECIK